MYSPYIYPYPYVYPRPYYWHPYHAYPYWNPYFPYGYRGAEENENVNFAPPSHREHELKDYGPHPLVINIEEATMKNQTFRTALWTGKHLQVTLMSINPGEDIGLEIHPKTDQFLRIESGRGLVQMGREKVRLDFQQPISDNDAIMVPSGTWHNVTNTGHTPLKLYSIYAPPQHPRGTVHETKAIAMAAEGGA
ncbi:cupin domain-containing protein [Xylanibacillus composti]|uniref:Cupin type-2 domain-containing protein n=1 Tax=Xylanibacillus composti TaxID=1572762 RepID=A0A8J4M2B9_9BACL|nr:cupin domain-containing protein [Xylanibacillus composti]MDT9726973.1 cupin domain-containing protein [Xylanibacillus composti]GIQ69529.1 hypothetical protein XYCOK13_23530 [Xylanibacillus composti]